MVTAESHGEHAEKDPQQRILDVARELFCRDGIHATGVDRIMARAGASKMTLYSRFGSKDALLRAVLVEEGAEWRRRFFAGLDGAADPQERLNRIVSALAEWFRGGPFYGCAFMNAVAEHTKGEAWLRALAAEHHAAILAYLGAQAEAAGYEAPSLLARQILLLIDGIIAAYMVSGDDAVFTVAQRTLDAILAAARP